MPRRLGCRVIHRSNSPAWLGWVLLASTFATLAFVAVAGAAPLVVDFKQSANNETSGSVSGLGNVHWIGSILQQNNSRYVEGMSTLQRIVLTNIPATTGDVHTLTFRHQAAKGSSGSHAYDFLTSWDQAVAAANAIAPGQGLLAMLNACGPEIGPPGGLGATCNSLRASGNMATPSCPDAMGTLLGDDIAAAAAAYEAVPAFGNRTIKVYAKSTASALSAVSLAFNGYTSGNDPDAQYTLTWTSNSDEILIEFAGHLASGQDPLNAGIGYGAGKGSASISGGPYHIPLDLLDGSSLGNQDNQIKGADIIIPCPTCVAPSGPSAVCPGTTAHTYTASFAGTCNNPVYAWSFGTNTSGATFCGPTNGPSVCVNAGSACGAFTLDVKITCDNCPEGITCSKTVQVEDTQAPVLSGCPSPTAAFQCLADVPPPPTVTATDNCPVGGTSVPVTFNETQSQPGSSCNNIITRVWSAVDGCGNTASCTQTITVNDDTPPTITCPGPVSVQCDADVPAPDPGSVAASDNCGTPTVEFVSDVSSGTCPKTITRTYRATDACGNVATCQQLITVDDTTNPTITCPSNISVQCVADVPACPGTLAAFLAAGGTASDNCDASLTYSCSDSPLSGTCPATITRTHQVTDDCGNTASCTQTITVNDETPPTITCQGNISVACNTPVTFEAPASDNCDASVAVECRDQNNNLVHSGDLFPTGTTTVTCTATDDCGNTAQCSFTVTVASCGEGCTPGFWCGGVGSTLWDAANDPQWTAAGGQGANPFTLSTPFESFFTPSSLIANNATMSDLLCSGGGSQLAQKAARDVIASYLNASFGLSFPLTPAQIAQKWADAVAAGTNQAFEALHLELGPLNEAGCPIGQPKPTAQAVDKGSATPPAAAGTPTGPADEKPGSDLSGLALYRPNPNPFTGTTQIAYAVPSGPGERVEIAVYDLAGRMIRSLVSGIMPAGRHQTRWDGRDAAGLRVQKGLYYVRVAIGARQRTVRVAYLR